MQHPKSFAFRHRLMIVSSCLMILIGCRGSEDVSFSFRESVGELPAKHQEQLKQYLVSYFGTATKPQLKAPDPEAELAEDGSVPLIDVLDPSRLRHGQLVFNRFCASCHGVTGTEWGPPRAS